MMFYNIDINTCDLGLFVIKIKNKKIPLRFVYDSCTVLTQKIISERPSYTALLVMDVGDKICW